MRNIVFLLALMIFPCYTAFASDNIQDAFSDGTLKGELRVFDFSREFTDSTTTRHDTAAGMLMYYNSDSLYGLSAGGAFATSNDIGSSDQDDVYGLLAKDKKGDHESFTRLQEYWVQGDYFKTKVKIGAQQIHSPWASERDVRLVPNTFKGLTVVNKSIPNLVASFYYITEFNAVDSTSFMSISKSINSNITEDKDLQVVSLDYDIPASFAKMKVQGWYYNVPDIFNTGWYGFDISKKYESFEPYLESQAIIQRSQGDELAGDISTEQYAATTGIRFRKGFDVSIAYAKTTDGDLLDPWGGKKGILQTVKGADRAHEDTYVAAVKYDFSKIGVNGLTALVSYGIYDIPGMQGPWGDMRETDCDVQYRFSGKLEGFKLRTRYSIVNIQNAADWKDVRIMASYTFTLKGKKK
ncbi:OprD family outer membrane porin [Seleniivibrio sp.]|uniref:OprD family outer membrane porin n=1 Tax=Seleniivibrio sp. TaxID=2898801 RepID=UPI0025ECEE4C|nr:OprD family outer membrane porin [Seleniivibrio sp.]MCD8553516.1 OprD family porin [Seleniivibrio sp.]